MNRQVLIRGGRVLDVGAACWRQEDLRLADGRVLTRGANAGRGLPDGTVVYDATGLLVTPGLVDAQVNGAAGDDLTRDPGSVPRVAQALLRHGVTSFVPTVISSAPGTVEAAARASETVRTPSPSDPVPRARGVGIHAEGPSSRRAAAARTRSSA